MRGGTRRKEESIARREGTEATAARADREGLTAVVLAGGRSRRMGRDKAFIPLEGRELLDRVLTAASGVADEVVIAAGDAVSPCAEALRRYGWADDLPSADRHPGFRRGACRAQVVGDREPGLGPLGGLEAAIQRARAGRIWVLACDLPFVNPVLGTLLLERLGRRRTSGGEGAREVAGPGARRPRAVVPRVAGRLQPLCAAYETAAGRTAARCLARGRRGMHQFLAFLQVETVAASALERAGDPRRLFLNINRPEDMPIGRDGSPQADRPRP